MNSLEQYIQFYDENRHTINEHAPQLMNAARPEARRMLEKARLPEKGDEGYAAVSLNDMFAPDYGVNITRVDFPIDTVNTFRCGVPNISSLLTLVANDSFRDTTSQLRNLPEGVQVLSLARVCRDFPGLAEKYLGRLAPLSDPVVALNTLLLQDGVFIRIQRNVQLEKPLQIVNIFNSLQPLMAVRRMVIVVEDGARGSLLVCDHSHLPEVKYLSEQVIEIYLGANARFDMCDMEESSPETSRVSRLYARQERDSRLTVNGTTLNGGVTRNSYNIETIGDNTVTNLAGMVAGADSQVIENYTSLRHMGNGSESRQMFKYVLDNSSVGSFYGTILVDEKALHTNAYQTNRNILASKQARMYTRPQLEIYCDEVKCSHGATVGQLDPRALFYMQSRGIPLHEARLMLMQAFMADVIDTVDIPSLRVRLQQLVENRLSGKRTSCSECAAAQNN